MSGCLTGWPPRGSPCGRLLVGKGMKLITFIVVVVAVCSVAVAFADIKPCEELKAEIESKLKAKGVEGYTLEIIPTNEVKDQKIIGSCEGGAKKISYSRKKAK